MAEKGKKYTHKCPIDGIRHEHPGKCPDHPDVDLLPIEGGEEIVEEEEIEEE